MAMKTGGRMAMKTGAHALRPALGRAGAGGGMTELEKTVCRAVCECLALAVLLLPVYAQDLTYWTLPELDAGMAACHEQVSQLSCDRQRTSARDMENGREFSSFADGDSIRSPVLEYACKWNPVVQTCEYRCNHLYKFPPYRISEQLDKIRVESHYIFEHFGAACTAFNIKPEENGNRECTICEDEFFNPPECYKIKNAQGEYIEKHPDCMTKCNMLPNCTSVCTNLVKESPAYADKVEEDAFMDCCIPQRRQLNGDTLDVGREQCCREYKLLQGFEMNIARNVCCNAIEHDLRGHTLYCASEICHFRLMEENISNARDVWVEETMREALQNDCVGGKCGVLGIVTRTSDGQMGNAMENNLISATDPARRSATFFDIVLRELPFNAPLNPDTVKVSTGIDTYFSESVAVGSFYFNAYFNDCNVNAPCKLQEGVEYDNLKKKYMVLYRGLIASGRFPDAVAEILYRQNARKDWEDTLPPYLPPLAQFAVPPFNADPADLPIESAIDHFHSLQATRRRAIGETMQTEFGPAVGSQRVGECEEEKGLMCISESGARQYNRRRRSCRDMSLYRPDEAAHMRPEWRLHLDRWLGSFGDFGSWKANMSSWRWQHAEEMRALEQWAASQAAAQGQPPNPR